MKDFAEVYKQNLIDIVTKMRDREKRSSRLGFDITMQMHELDSQNT